MARSRFWYWGIALVIVGAVAMAVLFGHGFASRKSSGVPSSGALESASDEYPLGNRDDDSTQSFSGAGENFGGLLQRDPAQAARLAVEANASFETALASWVRVNPRAAAAFAGYTT